ncbi:MAG: hypothetical protein HY328_11445 [Chloroflexi bacterium]|nr:hypothetical protein [Chloroflexota bacterium]
MARRTTSTPLKRASALPGWDALLLILLTVALVRIDSLAEAAVLPTLRQDVLSHPLLGGLLPAAGIAAMGERSPWPGEPVGLLLITLSLSSAFAYLLVDLARPAPWRSAAKWLLLACVLTTVLFLPTLKLVLLRQQSGPASYTHDGGVIQTEATIDFLLQGRNPYREEYTETPMAEWGFDEYRTALYHYPYLPWTFVFSAPFYLLGQVVGFYDQRLVYLLLLAIALALAPRLVQGERARLAAVMLLGLNPLMGLDVIFGQNDSFVLAWVIFSLVAWQQWRSSGQTKWRLVSALLFGLACASKPTAWFFAPFYGLLLLADRADLAAGGWMGLLRAIPAILRRVWPALLVFALLVGPYLLWDASAFYDDVWRWSSGQGETGYQIWGWGASNFVLILGLVADRFGQWPFWLLEAVVALPLLLWFVRRQQQNNQPGLALWHYATLLAAFFYTSRFLNENYLGYLLAFFALGYLMSEE